MNLDQSTTYQAPPPPLPGSYLAANGHHNRTAAQFAADSDMNNSSSYKPGYSRADDKSYKNDRYSSRHKDDEAFGRKQQPPAYFATRSIDPEIDKDRERFAGDYTSICLKNLNRKVEDSVLRDTLYAEFSRFGKFNVKIVSNRKNGAGAPGVIDDSRLAFLNFNSHEEAREAKRSKMGAIFYGYPLHIEPVFRSRSNSTFAPNRRSRSPIRSHGLFAKNADNKSQRRSRSRSRSRRPRSPSTRRRSRSGSRSRSVSRGLRSPPRHKEAPVNRSGSGHHLAQRSFANNSTPPRAPSRHSRGRSSRSPSSAASTYSSRLAPEQRHRPSGSPGDKRKFHVTGGPEHHRHRSRSRNGGSPVRRSRSRSRSPLTRNHYSHHSSAPYKPTFGSHQKVLPVDSASRHYLHDRSSSASLRHRGRSPTPPPPPPPSHRPSANRQDSWSSSTANSYRNANIRPPSFAPRPPTVGGIGHYLDDDERDATRTLFIGNLDYDIHCNDLKKIFEQFGFIEEIDIKRLTHSSNDPAAGPSAGLKAYAFVKFHNMDMAGLAKSKMNGKLIGKAECKIGYGKIQPTNCLWISGFTGKTQSKDIETYFVEAILNYKKTSRDRSQTTEKIKIDWKPGDRHGYVLCSSSEYAEEIRNQFRGKSFANGSSDRLRIDYAEAVKFHLSPDRSPSPAKESKEARRHHHQRERSASGHREQRRSRDTEEKRRSRSSSGSSRDHAESRPISTSSSGASLNKPVAQDEPVIDGVYRAKKLKPNETSPPQKPASSASSSRIVVEPAEKKANDANEPLVEPKKPVVSKSSFENIIITTTNDSRRVDTLPVATPSTTKRSAEPSDKNESEPAAKRSASAAIAAESSVNGKPEREIEEGEAQDSPEEGEGGAKSPSSAAKASPVSTDEANSEGPPSHHYNLGDEPFINSQLLNANLTSIEPIRDICEPLWSGMFVLKKNAFPTNFYMLSGNRELAGKYLPVNGSSSLLRISQRLRLDSTKIDELDRLLNESCLSLTDLSSELTFAILIALPTSSSSSSHLSPRLQQQIEQNQLQHRSIHYLIQYLNQKTAAGVIPLNDEKDSLVLHAFTPNCQFSNRILKQILPGLKSTGPETEIASSSSSPSEIYSGLSSSNGSNEYLVIVILKP